MAEVSRPGTVVDAMERAAQVTDRGFTFADGRGQERFVSFHELIRDAYGQAGALLALGLRPGERVALIIPDQQSFITAFFAALAVRLVPVPMYPPFSLAKLETWQHAAEAIMRVARPAAIVTVDEVCPVLWSVASRADAKIVTAGQLATHPQAPMAAGPVDPQDLAFLQFTSGSTTAPRGVMVSHRNIVENCRGITAGFLGGVEITSVSWLPLYHDMGLIGFVLAPLLALRPTIFLDTLAFLKRPSMWFELIHRHRATVTFAPHFAYALAVRRVTAEDLAGWDLSCLRVAGCGAEPIAANTLRAFAAHFAVAGLRPEALCPSYGLAEATLIVTHTPVDEPWRSQVVDAERLLHDGRAAPPAVGATTLELVSCGAPITGHTLRIIDDRGRPVPDGQIGEVEWQGPSVTGGYFADPGAGADTYAAGRLRTGDLGFLADGQLYITGRRRDVVIVHGRNYAPQTIEWALDGLSLVRPGNAVAFSYPDEHGVEQLAVVCESAAADQQVVQHAVKRRVSDELALTVNAVVVLQPGKLPKTSSGKVQRAKTRQLFLDGSLQRIGAPATQRGRRIRVVRLRWRAVTGSIRYRLHQVRWQRRRRREETS